MVEEYEARVDRLRAAMSDAGLTHIIAYGNCADPGHVRWLSGYPTSYGESIVVVGLDQEPMLVTNWVLHNEPMHTGIYHSWMRDTRVCEMGSAEIADEAAAALGALNGSSRVGLAGRRVIPQRIFARLSSLAGIDDFADGDTPLASVRRIKSAREIETMRQAARITGAGVASALAACVPGVTEQAVMGAAYHGYNADVSRCAIVGTPSNEALNLMIAAEQLFASMIELGRPGKSIAEWHQDGLRLTRELGYADFYKTEGLGHGLGCMVFERPSLRFHDNPELLEPGMTFAFEPMFVVDGLGTGVVEETILVTEEGLESLSGLPTRAFSR